MKLEEAKEIVQKLVAWFNLGNKSTTLGCEEFEALVMVAQKLEHLQKENEELKEHNRKYLEAEIFSAKQIKNFEKQVKQHYMHKNKIREKIEELNVSDGLEDNIAIPYLKDLLKEE